MTVDRYGAAEGFYKLAMAFAPVPDLHIMWLLHLCDAHQEMQSWAEAAQCAVAVAGVVMQASFSFNFFTYGSSWLFMIEKGGACFGSRDLGMVVDVKLTNSHRQRHEYLIFFI